MKSCVVDIETTDLAAVGSGIVLCVCVRPLSTGRTRAFRIDNYQQEVSSDFGFFQREENAMLKDVYAELDKYDLLIGHNVINFDIPYLRSRAYRHQIPWYSRPLVYDTLRGFRNSGFLTRQNGFGKPSASMDMVADFLGIEQLKTKIYPAEWWQAIWGNAKERLEAVNNIVDHCERDVRLNAAMYPILLANDPKVNIKRM